MKRYIPADVLKKNKKEFIKNFDQATHESGRLMLFAGDQKVEHLNRDFFGDSISKEDNSPEHLFKIASKAKIGVFATQFGLISRYGRFYKDIPYIVKMNSKTNIIPYEDFPPYSKAWIKVEDIVKFKKDSGLNILGVGYTVYLGSEFEREMLSEASKIIHKAHKYGLLAVLWIYPKGKYIKDEHNTDLIAGAAGVGACLGADFIKLKVPYVDGRLSTDGLKIVTQAAGNSGVLCEGGEMTDEKTFLERLYLQIHEGNSRGNGTGRNIHQRDFDEAVKMANAIFSITVENKTVEEALKILKD